MSVWRAQRQKETYTELSRSVNKALKAISIIRMGAIERYGWGKLQEQIEVGQSIVERLIYISYDPYYNDEELHFLYTGVRDTWVESDTTIRSRLKEVDENLSRLQENPQALSDRELTELRSRLEDIRDVANDAVEENKKALRGNFA